ncbi:hypothetical protein HaLaN_28377, partial [Haematococcus lacustris]
VVAIDAASAAARAAQPSNSTASIPSTRAVRAHRSTKVLREVAQYSGRDAVGRPDWPLMLALRCHVGNAAETQATEAEQIKQCKRLSRSRAQLHAYGRELQAKHSEAIALIFSSSGVRRSFDNLSFIGDNFARITQSTAHPHLVDAVFGLLAQLSSDNPSTQTAAADALEHAYVQSCSQTLAKPCRTVNVMMEGACLHKTGKKRAVQDTGVVEDGLEGQVSGYASPAAQATHLLITGNGHKGARARPSSDSAHQLGSPPAHGLQQPPSG